MIENYNKARRYLRKCDHESYLDILHDAYVKHYTRTGLNLFDLDQYLVFYVIKYEFLKKKREGSFKRNGERYYYQYTSSEDIATSITPLDLLVAKDYRESTERQLTDRGRKALDLLIQGYGKYEIAKQLRCDPRNVSKMLPAVPKKERSLNFLLKQDLQEVRKIVSQYECNAVGNKTNIPLLLKVLDLIEQGHQQTDIAKLLGKSDKRISFCVNRIKEIVEND